MTVGTTHTLTLASTSLCRWTLTGVQPEFLQRALQTNLVLSQCESGRLESVDDLVGTDAAVQVAFVVGIGFDRDRLLAQFVRQVCGTRSASRVRLREAFSRCFSTIRL